MAWVPPADDAGQNKIIYLCMADGCGAELGHLKRKYCTEHLSISGRASIKTENKEIDARLAELREKGEWIYATR